MQKTAFSLIKNRLAPGSPECSSSFVVTVPKWPCNKKIIVDCILVIKAIGKPLFPDQIYLRGKGNHCIGSALFCTVDTGSGFCLAWGKKTYVGKSAVKSHSLICPSMQQVCIHAAFILKPDECKLVLYNVLIYPCIHTMYLP